MKSFYYWMLGLAAAGVAALGIFSCSSDVSGILIGSGSYDVVYEFDNRTGTCVDSRPTLPDGSDNPNFGMPCPVPAANTLRLEFEGMRGATTPLFALRAHGFTKSDTVRVTFQLEFNPQILQYIYPKATENPRSPDYSGARPSGPFDGPAQGLANATCEGCCIEWTDLSCRYADGCKDFNTSHSNAPVRERVTLCVKRSLTPSGDPGPAPDYACGVECCKVSVSNCTTSGTCPTDKQNVSNLCRTDNLTAAENAACPQGCNNSCNEPLFTDGTSLLCCIPDLAFEKGECPVTPVVMDGVVAYIPLHGFSARVWDDFNFLFSLALVQSKGLEDTLCCQPGQSDIDPGLECVSSPSPCVTWRTGKGTIVIAQ